MQDGEERYVSVKVYRRQTGMNIGWPPYLSVEPHDIGEAQSADTSPAKSDHVQDIAKLDLAKLQAEPKARARNQN